jgi:hypothetical protein
MSLARSGFQIEEIDINQSVVARTAATLKQWHDPLRSSFKEWIRASAAIAGPCWRALASCAQHARAPNRSRSPPQETSR